MLQDRFRKKIKSPFGGASSSFEIVDIADNVPQIDDVLSEVDRALEKAKLVQEQTKSKDRPSKRCGC